MSERVTLVEVGPRDGLQNESTPVSTDTKLAFIEALRRAGHRAIEATAFVSPKAIPQLADAEAVATKLAAQSGVRWSALVPNEAGYLRTRGFAFDEVSIFVGVSDTFNQRNIRATAEEAFARFAPVMAAAAADGRSVRGYVSTITHCPYEGRIDPRRTAAVVSRLLALGCREVSLGETIGHATPAEIRELLACLAADGTLPRCAGHFHDTYGMGVANVLTALEFGMRVFDAAAGGLGGCPYAQGAAGNVATEDLVWLFRGLGLETGIDLDAQCEASALIQSARGRPLPGRTFRARYRQ